MIVPFAIRYLILITPLYIILVVIHKKIFSKYIVCLFAVITLVQAGIYVSNQPQRDIQRINQLLWNSRFEDLYESSSGINTNRFEYAKVIHQFEYQITSDKSQFNIQPVGKITTNSLPIKFDASYVTPIGSVAFETMGNLVNQQGKWVLVWDWEFIAPHFSPENIVMMEKGDQIGGSLISKDGKVLSRGAMLPHIALVPQEIINEEQLLEEVKTLTGIDKLPIRFNLHVNHSPSIPKRIGFVIPNYNQALLQQISTQSGVLITAENHPQARLYPQGVIDNKFLGQIKALEDQHQELTNYLQGYITIQKKDESHTIYTAPNQTPSDVFLEKTVDELLGFDAHLVF